ncbi:MAG TPA: lipase family protein [Methylotenera sp.]|nr:lipase family protein [Methylotenera sp.]
MSNGYITLKNHDPLLDLDIAILLAEASAAAYSDETATIWALQNELGDANLINQGNIQGFWCVKDDVALLAFRGTSNPGQWIRDVRILPMSHPWGWIHRGFGKGIENIEEDYRKFLITINQLSGRKVWVTGHSLGGALAVIAAANLKIDKVTPIVYTYGQPRPSYGEFAERFAKELPSQLYRFINQSDIVARVPPDPFYNHSGTPKRIINTNATGAIFGLVATNPDIEIIQQVVSTAEPEIPTISEAIHDGEVFLKTSETASVTPEEFSKLQKALGADAEPLGDLPEETFSTASAEAQLAGAIPFFADHAISEYIRLLKEIKAISQ